MNSSGNYSMNDSAEGIEMMARGRRRHWASYGVAAIFALLTYTFLVLWAPILAQADYSQMVFADERLLWKAGLLGDFQSTVLPLPPELGYVQIDDVAGKIYFIEFTGRFLKRMNLDGNQVEELLGTSRLAQLGIHALGTSPGDNGIDTVAGKVYWLTREYGQGMSQIVRTTLSAMNLDGTGLSEVLRQDNIAMQHLLVDVVGQRLYWVEQQSSAPTSAIRSSALDGSDVKGHVIGIPTGVAGLDVDSTGQRLYWTSYARPSGDNAALWRVPLVGPPVDMAVGGAEHVADLGRNAPGRPVLDDSHGMVYLMTREPLRNINRTVPVLKGVDLQSLPLTLETIYQTSSLDFHYATLGSSQGVFYWTESESLPTGQKTGVLWGISADGSTSPVVLSKNNTPVPAGVASDSATGKVYWALPELGAIRQSALDGAVSFTDIVHGLNQPQDVAVDPIDQTIYWSEPQSGSIKRANLDGTGTEVFVGGLVGSVGRLALDVADRTLYWTGDRGIEAFGTDRTGRRTVLEGTSSAARPLGIAVDSRGRQIYWTEPTSGVIKRSNLDGTRVRTIVNSRPSPAGIAVDSEAQTVYWTERSSDGRSGLILSANIDGTHIETIIEGQSPSLNDIALVLVDEGPVVAFPTGDVSGDFKVDVYDAALILQFSVGLIHSFPADDLLNAAPDQVAALDYEVRIPTLSAEPGERVLVPVHINEVSGSLAGAVTMTYDPSILEAHQVHMSLSGAYWKANTDTEGEVRIAFAALENTRTEGDLFVVEFDVLPAVTGGESPLALDYVTFSNSLSIQKTDGLLTVAPDSNRLLPNYPNPFNPETWIPYQLAEPNHVLIRIFDQRGQFVRSLDLGSRPAGIYLSRGQAAYWNGRNNANEPIASGTYFYVLQAGDFTATRKMVVVR